MKMLLALILSLSLAACSQRVSIHSTSEVDMDYTCFNSYTWPVATAEEKKRNPFKYTEFSNQHIRRAVEGELNARGYHHSDSTADLTIHYHFVIEDKKLLIQNNEISDTYLPSWYPCEHFSYDYQQGSFIIDIIEVSSGRIIWRGWSEKVINSYPFQLTLKEINVTVKKIFEKYPVRPRNIQPQPLQHARNTVISPN
ncbi:MAG: DUF4136 domain-containing protein [Cyclobacteriaceae bacterium]|nr:DUF4136 domain-containing protein [Cyclobacteriaceae bacterium]